MSLTPIDAAARDGTLQLLHRLGTSFLLVRWTPQGWTYASGRPLTGHAPTHYRRCA